MERERKGSERLDMDLSKGREGGREGKLLSILILNGRRGREKGEARKQTSLL